MARYRCPDPLHGESPVPLKANNDRVYECPRAHKFWRREEGGGILLVDLITQASFPAVEMEGPAEPEGRQRLNFMVDVPRVRGGLDFDALSLPAPQWKIISRIDGTSNLEEVRLLAGLTPTEAEEAIHSLVEAGLIEVRRRGGR